MSKVESNSMDSRSSEEGEGRKFMNLEEHEGFLPFLVIPPPHPEEKKRKRRIPIWMPEEFFNVCDSCWRAKRPNTRSLYSLFTNKVYEDELSLPYNRHCRGSSFGWLVTMKRKDWTLTGKRRDYITKKVKYYVQLHNPFLPPHLESTIPLPPLPLHGLVPTEDLTTPFVYLRKAILSSPPDNNHNKNFIVLAMVSARSRLAFYDPAAKASFCWTPIGDWNKWKDFSDVIYSQKAQQFYAVLNDTGAVFSIGGLNDGSTPYFKPVAPPVTANLSSAPFRRYIVESPTGELLQVCKSHGYERTGEDEWGEVGVIFVIFNVFMLGPGGEEWIQVHNLEDTILFLGCNASFSCAPSAFPECNLRPSSIYFTDDSEINILSQCGFYQPPCMGIYNMEDGTVNPILSPRICYGPQATAPIWLRP